LRKKPLFHFHPGGRRYFRWAAGVAIFTAGTAELGNLDGKKDVLKNRKKFPPQMAVDLAKPEIIAGASPGLITKPSMWLNIRLDTRQTGESKITFILLCY